MVRRLVHAGARVWLFARPRAAVELIADVVADVKMLSGDLRVRREVVAAVEAATPDVIFHLAAHGVNLRNRNPMSIMQTNAIGTMHLLEVLAPVPYSRFVNTGSCFEYGNCREPISEARPLEALNVYAASKIAAFHLCALEQRQRAKPIVTLRPFTFFGPGERENRLIPSVLLSILRGQPIRITSGTQTRDYTYVEDMVTAFVRAAVCEGAVGRVVNVGSGEDYTVREIVQRIRHLMKSDVPVEYGALPPRADDAERLCADNTLARTLLGWRPEVTFEEGVERTAGWLRPRVWR